MTVSDEAANIIREQPELASEIARQMASINRPMFLARVGLTFRQRQALDFIEAFAEEHNGLTPSYDEIREFLGYSSKSHVFSLVSALEERGYIIRLPHRARSIQLIEVA